MHWIWAKFVIQSIGVPLPSHDFIEKPSNWGFKDKTRHNTSACGVPVLSINSNRKRSVHIATICNSHSHITPSTRVCLSYSYLPFSLCFFAFQYKLKVFPFQYSFYTVLISFIVKLLFKYDLNLSGVNYIIIIKSKKKCFKI